MIDRNHEFPVKRQAQLLDISRSSAYYRLRPMALETLALMKRIDELHLELPFAGFRMLRDLLALESTLAGRHRIRCLERLMGICALYRKNTSAKHAEHPLHPYLLRSLEIDQPNQVWASDITFFPMARGFLYPVVIFDSAMRKILAWRLSNRLTAIFCADALEEALARYGKPEIRNPDQGGRFVKGYPNFPSCGH